MTRRVTAADTAARILADVDSLRRHVVAMVEGARDERVRGELAGIDVLRLRETTERNLRLQALVDAGIATVLDALDAGTARLDALPGVGPHTARTAVAAAERLAQTLRAGARLRIEPGTRGPLGLDLVTALHRLARVEPLLAPEAQHLADFSSSVAALAPVAAPATSRLGFALRLPSTKARARQSLARLADWEAWLAGTGLPATLERLTGVLAEPAPGPLALWQDFERRAADYYALLDTLVPGLGDHTTRYGALPAELVERITAYPLDESLLHANLRGYQAFGARFALNQGRALIGDEMGLGKTVQAIAAMAHLAAAGETHFLVVCPASVLVNWTREVSTHARLVAHRVHGADRDTALRSWQRSGGVAVTTFQGLQHVPSSATHAPPALLVVDEAHYVKNPQAGRTQAVAAWAARTPRVLFLTGTPLLNDVTEMTALATMLQPELVAALPGHLRLLGAEDFRHALAPVYLRRNLEDVLVELPPRLTVDDWEELTPAGERAYRDAVAAGNLMAMRRADLTVPDPRDSAKLDRLLEIVAEARDGGQRVVVFSFFRDVIARVVDELGALPGIEAHGPITGDVPAARRQDIVDRFSAAGPGAVLVSQVQAGGVGLNVQAASVVVLTEPQLVPAVEEQAIGRVHRMGQVRPVQVHRLLTEDSVDERLEELLAGKRAVFDAYARESSLAQQAESAVDVSEAELARHVVAAEQARLGYGPVWDELMADDGT
ncbi:DEAD/DEAH box helicase [Georgenia sunbinii]|uniref:DEAD/DEAH box helicase n=1 Tax=Georgenia sunbinii TaxID=3117728 RepID=UPI002F26DB04